MIFKKIKKEHQSILEEWLKDKSTQEHLGGMLPLENFINYLITASDRLPYLVFENEMPIGMVDIEFYPKEKTASLSLLIHPDLRKKGLGTFLLKAILQLNCYENCARLDAFIEPDNIASIKCFQKAGFAKINELPDEDGMYLYSYFL